MTFTIIGNLPLLLSQVQHFALSIVDAGTRRVWYNRGGNHKLIDQNCQKQRTLQIGAKQPLQTEMWRLIVLNSILHAQGWLWGVNGL